MSNLGYAFHVASFVCWIIVLIQMFKRQHVGLGVVGILCALVAFVYGWIKAREWGITMVMLVWTACLILGGTFTSLGGGFHLATR